jgi:lambda family phage portal protein
MKKRAKKTASKDGHPLAVRGYREAAAVGGGVNNDWPLSMLGEDSDVWQNAWALTSRVRDLFRTNPTYQSYRETFWANVYGSNGIMLRSTVKENEDRVVHSADEKKAIRAFEERRNRVLEWLDGKQGIEFKQRSFLDVQGTNGSRVATIKVGQPDVFARQLIERKWRDWQQAKYSDSRGTRDYHTQRLLRGISAVRDGDFFIRMIRDTSAGFRSHNPYGFTLQMINAEWCDRFFNGQLPNGNEVRMGIEYQQNSWGLGKPVAYYFIKRQPNDWQFSIPGAFNFSSGNLHVRIAADEVVHCARPVDAESTRPAPWVASTIPKARQLDQYELAEVIAARAQACKTGVLYSDIVPEGGTGGMEIDPKTSLPTQALSPGDIMALKYGVKYQEVNPTHPNGNAENFRKMMMRAQCAGMPGSSYPTMAHDYEAINFSAGRLARLDSNELFKMIQTWDISGAENTIFENWLETSLITGAIPLPLAKFDKFNSKTFQGRRWRGVDENKEATAAALRVANKFSSRTRENADVGNDFEEIVFELAEEEMLLESFGLSSMLTVEKPPKEIQYDEEEGVEDDATPTKKPAKKKSNRLDHV